MVIGDSNSDYFPAKSIESNFFPIIPHKEIESWSAFINEGADKFFSDFFSNNYQSLLENLTLALIKNQTGMRKLFEKNSYLWIW